MNTQLIQSNASFQLRIQ